MVFLFEWLFQTEPEVTIGSEEVTVKSVNDTSTTVHQDLSAIPESGLALQRWTALAHDDDVHGPADDRSFAIFGVRAPVATTRSARGKVALPKTPNPKPGDKQHTPPHNMPAPVPSSIVPFKLPLPSISNPNTQTTMPDPTVSQDIRCDTNHSPTSSHAPPLHSVSSMDGEGDIDDHPLSRSPAGGRANTPLSPEGSPILSRETMPSHSADNKTVTFTSPNANYVLRPFTAEVVSSTTALPHSSTVHRAAAKVHSTTIDKKSRQPPGEPGAVLPLSPATHTSTEPPFDDFHRLPSDHWSEPPKFVQVLVQSDDTSHSETTSMSVTTTVDPTELERMRRELVAEVQSQLSTAKSDAQEVIFLRKEVAALRTELAAKGNAQELDRLRKQGVRVGFRSSCKNISFFPPPPLSLSIFILSSLSLSLSLSLS